jgi:very-short-patch-repair endonuclease
LWTPRPADHGIRQDRRVKPRKPLPPVLRGAPFTTQQGLAAGVGRERLRGSDLAHPFRGVYTAEVGDTDVAGLCRALQARLPSHAFFSDVTAAQIFRIPLPWAMENSRILHVAVPAPKTAPTGKGFVGHSVRVAGGDVCDWDGLRLSSPQRTWCLLASRLSVPELVAAGDYLIHWELPLTSRDALEAAVRRHGSRPGRAALLESLPLLDDRAESAKESELRVIFVRAGLQGLVTNVNITTADGFRYRADLAFPRKKVLVEYQSRFHDGSINFRADMTRISRLEADGWIVIQVNNDDLANPVELVRRVRRVLDRRVGDL